METSQHEMYEYARLRIKQKKRLYFHFVLLFLGSIFLFIVTQMMPQATLDSWFVWIVSIWVFLFVLHFIKVFITDSFMNKKWERDQIDRLITKQEKKIEQLKIEIDKNSETTT